MTSVIFVIIVLIMTPAGPKPIAPFFIYPSWALCEANRAVGDKLLLAAGKLKLMGSYCIEIKGSV
tara:strand:+ start:219 stop:413 length:195 start_codon:yes stop_codon:yes gene_type:complete